MLSDTLALPGLGFLGCGKMGQALMQGVLADQRISFKSVWAATRSTDISHLPCIRRYGVNCTHDPRQLAKHCEIIIVGVNFECCRSVLTALARDNLLENKLIISIVSSISCDTLSSWDLQTNRIVRAMPNTPCEARAGLTAICATPATPSDDLHLARTLFECVGLAVCIPERLLPGWTCAAGCGPAYVFLLLEAVSDAIVAGGLPREMANEMATYITGSNAQFALQQKRKPYIDDHFSAVYTATSAKLQEAGYNGIVMEAVEAARNRDRYLEEHPDS